MFTSVAGKRPASETFEVVHKKKENVSIAFNYEGWKTEEISNVAYHGFARNLWVP